MSIFDIFGLNLAYILFLFYPFEIRFLAFCTNEPFLVHEHEKTENKNGNCGQCLNPQTMYQINIKKDL